MEKREEKQRISEIYFRLQPKKYSRTEHTEKHREKTNFVLLTSQPPNSLTIKIATNLHG